MLRPTSEASGDTIPHQLTRFLSVRRRTMSLAAPLSIEDQALQSMADASPTKWHLAHTTWFFETFLLAPDLPGYTPFNPDFRSLFNSYYDSVGPQPDRGARGLLSRPGHDEIIAYRAHVDDAMGRLLLEGRGDPSLIELGLHHEQQHQELILMDIKHAFWRNPGRPAYQPAEAQAFSSTVPTGWIDHPGGLVEIGHAGPGFAFDNEGPRHRVWLEPFAVADRLVTCGEWLAFMEAGGYDEPRWWLSDGWANVRKHEWRAPLYWRQTEAGWRVFSLTGEHVFNPSEPVCHVSFYEADAFARFAGRRLPTEAEWEITAASSARDVAPEALHPTAQRPDFTGQVWQWTSSAYHPYPRFRPAEDATGEYNGKFMTGQMVLRGGACVTPPGHARLTYRNFFPPHARWAFSGVRLAADA